MNKKALSHFKTHDPVLHSVALQVGVLELRTKELPGNYFRRLCDEIVSQQLSGKAAETIFNRFLALFKNKPITPKDVLKIPHETLRAVGMSNAKAKYVKNLATEVEEGRLNLKTLDTLLDEEVINELTKVKGIGRWTAEMFLMFVLGRDDIYSHGDLGLRKAIKALYKMKKDPTVKQTEKIIKKWSPYRTWAARILWKSLEIKV